MQTKQIKYEKILQKESTKFPISPQLNEVLSEAGNNRCTLLRCSIPPPSLYQDFNNNFISLKVPVFYDEPKKIIVNNCEFELQKTIQELPCTINTTTYGTFLNVKVDNLNLKNVLHWYSKQKHTIDIVCSNALTVDITFHTVTGNIIVYKIDPFIIALLEKTTSVKILLFWTNLLISNPKNFPLFLQALTGQETVLSIEVESNKYSIDDEVSWSFLIAHDLTCRFLKNRHLTEEQLLENIANTLTLLKIPTLELLVDELTISIPLKGIVSEKDVIDQINSKLSQNKISASMSYEYGILKLNSPVKHQFKFSDNFVEFFNSKQVVSSWLSNFTFQPKNEIPNFMEWTGNSELKNYDIKIGIHPKTGTLCSIVDSVYGHKLNAKIILSFNGGTKWFKFNEITIAHTQLSPLMSISDELFLIAPNKTTPNLNSFVFISENSNTTEEICDPYIFKLNNTSGRYELTQPITFKSNSFQMAFAEKYLKFAEGYYDALFSIQYNSPQ